MTLELEVDTRPALVVRGTTGPAPDRRPGERLEQLFEQTCDALTSARRADHPAVQTAEHTHTYPELDRRANQLARHLQSRGVRPGARVALLFDEAWRSYVAMLAVLKLHAAYVPLDVGFPRDRLGYIAADAGVEVVLSLSHLREHVTDVPARPVFLDEVDVLVDALPHARLTEQERGTPVEELAYIIYTSGSTGRPKGVAIDHASICNFVRVAADAYGLQSRDRVYQGMTIAFDFSVEEIWVPWAVGATLVPKPGGASLLGQELSDYLAENEVSALCCVPTLLSTLEQDLPGLRFLLVSGEACPQDLITRWHRPGRRFLNVYGPTEATVTATWSVVHPDRPVTLGVPLPTYSIVILDPEADRAMAPGELGEIGIAVVGLAVGYVNRPDLTAKAFIADFLGLEDNPSRRIYRSGDLGRVDEQGEIEYHGRIDTQVKIRGYRIELTEIESVVLQVPGVAAAVVDTYELQPGVTELVAWYSVRTDSAGVDTRALQQHLRAQLPAYMVPAYLEELAAIPMLPSDKADRKGLPAPRGRTAGPADHVAPGTDTERDVAQVLAQVMHLTEVSTRSHFFDDLGANSLTMASFCARAKEHRSLPPLAMKDVYLHPTVQSLAAALDLLSSSPVSQPALGRPPVPVVPASTASHVFCGVLQLLLFLAYSVAAAAIWVSSVDWVAGATGLLATWERSIVVGAGSFFALSVAPVLTKWTLIGRWTAQDIPVWSLAYLRFWLVKTLVRSNPMRLFVGSPLYVLYLRALGARIGRGVVILSADVPVCTDLLTIGSGSVIRKDSTFTCYRAEAGRIHIGPVALGADVLVGEATVLDIGTSMGDGSQLGHTSSLHQGQDVPTGHRWHGSPARRTEVEHRGAPTLVADRWRPVAYSVLQLVNRLVLLFPLGIGATAALLLPGDTGDRALLGVDDGAALLELAGLSLVLFVLGIPLALGVAFGLPRLLRGMVRPDVVYPLYGSHYAVQRLTARLTNNRFFMEMLGDSSYVVPYLRGLGYDLSRVQQTGSNFGVALKHETPYLSTVGSGTMVSDGLSIMNAHFSSTSFKVSRVSIGANSFYGNNIVYPIGGRTGDNCLLATKAMIPLDGPVREGVGLLGSPCFEIPRSVERDKGFETFSSAEELPRRLSAKNRHNLRSIGAYLFTRWLYLFATLLLLALAAALQPRGAFAVAPVFVAQVLFTAMFFVLVERASMAFRPLSPLFCSIYERPFWQHERFWKLSATGYLELFNGTPFKSVIWRALGVRIGRRVFDDGCAIPEKTLVTIGDDCTLNAQATIQCHSMEDGAFKSEPIVIGPGVTIGVNAFVHYGTQMGEGSVLDCDAFLMKGSEVSPRARWQGNPAAECASGPVSGDVGPRALAPAHAGSVALGSVALGSAVAVPAVVVPAVAVPAVAVPAAAVPAVAPAAAARPVERPGEDLRELGAALLTDLRVAPGTPVPVPSGLELALFSLEAGRRREPELRRFLTPGERDRAERITSDMRRTAYVAGRALTRLVLSAHRSDIGPDRWRLEPTDAGKVVVVEPADSGLDVSISHSDSVLAVAVSPSHDIGVDLEPVDRTTDAATWTFVLSDSEQARLAAMPEVERPVQFLGMWTLKEAMAKCLGLGVDGAVRERETLLDPPAVRPRRSAPDGQAPWSFHQARYDLPGAAHWLAVASRPRPTASVDRAVRAPSGSGAPLADRKGVLAYGALLVLAAVALHAATGRRGSSRPRVPHRQGRDRRPVAGLAGDLPG